ncbi:YozE family protein [Oceanobacillus iheyensis]|uniref:YozE family protein n=1 Tax=Oceanobacillus iheyensis TaxID=182710 RepID=UPI00362D3B3D
MEQTFYQFLMTYRGKLEKDDNSELAEWAFRNHNFPKHSNSYDEISNYLEWNSPFPSATVTFDSLWNEYEWKKAAY